MAMNALNPRIRVIWVVRSLIGALILGGAAGGIAVYRSASLTIPASLTVLFVALGVGHAILRYRSWQYVVGDDALYLERGVLTQVRTEVPLVRIQHVDSRRSAVERLVGLASTVVYTAGSRGADVSVPGLGAGEDDDLRERLKRLAIRSESEDAV